MRILAVRVWLLFLAWSASAALGAASFTPGPLNTDGRYVVFSTELSLLPADENGLEDVYRYDHVAKQVALVSTRQDRAASGNARSFSPCLSADGAMVAFASEASDLVAGDQNGTTDVFVRDLNSGVTTLVSVNFSGTNGGNGPSFRAQLSGDGRFVAFESAATDLVTNDDANGAAKDVFVRDRTAGITTLVSVDVSGLASGDLGSELGGISADGRVVVFISRASTIVTNLTQGEQQVFARDLTTGKTTMVSMNPAGAGGNDDSFDPVVSANGMIVAFGSQATDLISADANVANDIFVRDLPAGATELISVNRFGTGSGNGTSFAPKLSADGNVVAFASGASDLVTGDENNDMDVFTRDRRAAVTTLASVNRSGTGSGNGRSDGVALSADGRVVAFVSKASDLTTNVVDGLPNLFVSDVSDTPNTRLVSINRSGGGNGNDPAVFHEPSLSADGRVVAFRSTAHDLTADNVVGAGEWFLFGEDEVRPSSRGAFVESQGLVVMEAEHFSTNIAASNHAWQVATNQVGFMGEAAVQALPNLGLTITASVATSSPALFYQVQFATAGPRKFWVRGWGANGSDDSVYIGLDGVVQQTVPFGVSGAWVWRSRTVTVPTAGEHTVNVWMREDGAYVDRLLLAANPGFIPATNGPPESSREVNQPPGFSPVTQIVSPAPDSIFREGTTITVAATAEDADGTVASVRLYANGVLLTNDTEAPFAADWRPASGTYELYAVATDDLGNITASPTVTVRIVDANIVGTLQARLNEALLALSYLSSTSIVVQVSSDLVQWQNLAGLTNITSTTSQSGGLTEVTLRLPRDAPEHFFFRLKRETP